MSPNAGDGGGGLLGLSQWEQLWTWSPNKLRRYNSIFNPWPRGMERSGLFETEANKDSRSTFERVSFHGWSSRFGTRDHMYSRPWLVLGLVQKNIFPPSSYPGSIEAQCECLFNVCSDVSIPKTSRQRVLIHIIINIHNHFLPPILLKIAGSVY